MSVICLLCGLVMDYSPKIFATRTLLMSFLLGCMLFDTVFIALWTKSMTTPFYNVQIKLKREIIDNHFQLAGDGFALQHILKHNQVRYSMKCEFKLNINLCWFTLYLDISIGNAEKL